MMKAQRPAPPLWLTQKCQKWGQQYERKLATTPATQFAWPQYQRKRLNHWLLPLLRQMTEDHCSFCDVFQMVAEIRETIEHFKPKSQYPIEAYQWDNLFLCCDKCQSAKREFFDPALLKPDEIDYEFDRYFIFNFSSGELHPNPTSNTSDQNKASLTIEIYGLNTEGRPQARRRVFENYCQSTNPQIKDFSYRFMFL